MAKVELKQPIVDEIKAQLDGAKSMVVVDYRGISVADVTELRKQCREAGVVYKVYKNTMVKRAVEGTYYDAAGIATIATIPSRDELIAKFMGSIQSPVTNFARVIKQIAEKKDGGAAESEAAAE